MISEFFGWLLAILVIDPLHAQVKQHAEQMKLSTEIVAQVQDCALSEGRRLIEQATGDYGWATVTAVKVAIGHLEPIDLLDAGKPQCAALLKLLPSADSEA